MCDGSTLPTLDSNNNTVVTIHKNMAISPNKVYIIELGYMLLSVPSHSIIRLKNSNQSFKLLHKFWYPSQNMLTLPIIAAKPIRLHVDEVLCQLQLVSIYDIISGNSNKHIYFYNAFKQ
jgi:hypothetical protein